MNRFIGFVGGDTVMARAITRHAEPRFEFARGSVIVACAPWPIQPCALVESDVEPTRPGEYIAHGVTGGTGRNAPRFDRLYSLADRPDPVPMRLATAKR